MISYLFEDKQSKVCISMKLEDIHQNMKKMRKDWADDLIPSLKELGEELEKYPIWYDMYHDFVVYKITLGIHDSTFYF